MAIGWFWMIKSGGTFCRVAPGFLPDRWRFFFPVNQFLMNEEEMQMRNRLGSFFRPRVWRRGGAAVDVGGRHVNEKKCDTGHDNFASNRILTKRKVFNQRKAPTQKKEELKKRRGRIMKGFEIMTTFAGFYWVLLNEWIGFRLFVLSISFVCSNSP